MSQRDAVDNLVQPFQLETGVARGRLVRLGSVVDTILSRHAYPEPVAEILGELLALTAGFAGALKFDGLLTLQTESSGPVSMMVADFTTPGALRGYAKYDAGKLGAQPAGAATSGSVPKLLGAGHLVFTVDQGADTQLYQGFVELEGATLAECAHHYFRQSEQLDAALRLAARRRPGAAARPRWRAGGLMVQRMPARAVSAPAAIEGKGDAEDAWRHALALVGCLTDDELTARELTPADILYRLFHEQGVRVFTPRSLGFRCRCSRRRVRRILESLSEERLSELAEDGRILATCEFCKAVYEFAEEDFGPGTRP